MITSFDIGTRNAKLLSDKLHDDLKNNKLGPKELKDYINSIKDWLKQRDPSPEDIQAMSDDKLTHTTNLIKNITVLLRDIDEVMDNPDNTHFFKALVIIPKISDIAYFQTKLNSAINTE